MGIKFRKQDLFVKKLDAEGFVGYNQTNSLLVDTSLSAYTWNGKVYTKRQYGGEISTSRNLLTFQSDQYLGQASLTYPVGKNHRFNLSYLVQSFSRKGSDPVVSAYYGEDNYKRPTTLLKHVAGSSYQLSLFRSKILSISSLKYFGFNSHGFIVVNAREIILILLSISRWVLVRLLNGTLLLSF